MAEREVKRPEISKSLMELPTLVTYTTGTAIKKLTETHLLVSKDVGGEGTDFYIYGDVITLSDKIIVPGANVTIHARVICTNGDVELNTSAYPVPEFKKMKADDGAASTSKGGNGGDGLIGERGAQGKKAGNITLVAGEYKLGGKLTLIANGSKGANGQDGGNGADGAAGTDSPDDNWKDALSGSHKAEAGGHGGHGGNAGYGGFCGNGGDAGEILVVYTSLLDTDKVILQNTPGQAGEKGKNGKPGKGGKGGRGGIQYVIAHLWEVQKKKLTDGNNGSKGKADERYSRQEAFKKYVKNGRTGEAIAEENGHRHGIVKLPFSDIITGFHFSKEKITGRMWWTNHLTDYPAKECAHFDPRICPNPEHMSMMAHRVELKYLAAADETDYKKLLDILQWLYRISDPDVFFNEYHSLLAKTEPGAQQFSDIIKEMWDNRAARQNSYLIQSKIKNNKFFAYKKAQVELFIKDWNKNAAQEAVFARRLECWKRADADFYNAYRDFDSETSTIVHVTAGTLLAQLSRGLDFYGNPRNYIPNVNFLTYQSQYNILVSSGKLIEDLFLEYKKTTKSQDELLQKIGEIADNHVSLISEKKSELERIAAVRLEIEREIPEKLIPPVRAKEDNLRKNAVDFLRALQQELVISSVVSTVKVIASVYTMGTTGSAGISIATAALGALGAGGATDILNEKKPSENRDEKKKVIEIEMEDFSKTRALKESEKKKKEEEKTAAPKDKKEEKEPGLGDAFDNLKKCYEAGVDVIGEGMKIKDNITILLKAKETYGVNAAMLLMTEQEFDEQLKPVIDKVKDEGGKFKAAFVDYRKAVKVVQEKVLLYKSLFAKHGALTNEIAITGAKVENIKHAIAIKADPTTGSIKNTLLEMCNSIKIDLIDYLYQQHLALGYMFLDDTKFTFTTDQNIAFLSAGHAKLSKRYLEHLKSQHGFPQDKTIAITLTRDSHPFVFEELSRNKQAMLSISLNKEIKGKIGKAFQFVLHKMQIEMYDVYTSNNMVQIGIEHSGLSLFIDSAGKEHNYCHDAMIGYFHYTYEITEKEGYVISERKKEGGNFKDKKHLLLSPFSTWRISLPSGDNDNEGLDLTNLKRIVVTFFGSSTPKK